MVTLFILLPEAVQDTQRGRLEDQGLRPTLHPWALGPRQSPLPSQNLSFPVCKIDMDPACSLCKFVM